MTDPVPDFERKEVREVIVGAFKKATAAGESMENPGILFEEAR